MLVEQSLIRTSTRTRRPGPLPGTFYTRDALTDFPDTPLFDVAERKRLEHNEALAPFTAITKRQLFGLLVALGEYAYRVDRSGATTVFEDENGSQAVEANRILLRCYWDHTSGRAATVAEPYFTPAERERLRLRKYVQGEHMSKSDIISLLDAVG
jgi:hypothetical protein